MRTSWCRALLAVLAAGAVVSGAQTEPRSPLVVQSFGGRELFESYCASCHGRDGRGSGPAAGALTTAPPDLTRLARRHGGVFPRERVETFVANDGDALAPAHGTPEMPVWGPILRALDPSDTPVKVRIANLVGYVESLQAK
jgi:mono/diheme cytochrome c family protein